MYCNLSTLRKTVGNKCRHFSFLFLCHFFRSLYQCLLVFQYSLTILVSQTWSSYALLVSCSLCSWLKFLLLMLWLSIIKINWEQCTIQLPTVSCLTGLRSLETLCHLFCIAILVVIIMYSLILLVPGSNKHIL